MYMLPDMIDMGLKRGQKFPSAAHRTVAQNVALCNSLVTTRDELIAMVQAVIRVPKKRITKITLQELASEFECPNIRLS